MRGAIAVIPSEAQTDPAVAVAAVGSATIKKPAFASFAINRNPTTIANMISFLILSRLLSHLFA